MSSKAVELRVGGQTYRVIASADESELRRLAAMVDAKLATMVRPGRPVSPQSLLLAAISLAHDLEEERRRVDSIATKARSTVTRMLERVDGALVQLEER
jgi:cell division protein ZapA